jgi:hypothetical protein
MKISSKPMKKSIFIDFGLTSRSFCVSCSEGATKASSCFYYSFYVLMLLLMADLIINYLDISCGDGSLVA